MVTTGMKRLDKFKASARPYALDPASFRPVGEPSEYHRPDKEGKSFQRYVVNAIWFKRKEGVRFAMYGTLGQNLDTEPQPAYDDFVAQYQYGRYGGNALARWAPERGLWTPGGTLKGAEIVDLLDAALKNYPNLPVGYDGWFDIRED